jgi:hypothetical protein
LGIPHESGKVSGFFLVPDPVLSRVSGMQNSQFSYYTYVIKKYNIYFLIPGKKPVESGQNRVGIMPGFPVMRRQESGRGTMGLNVPEYNGFSPFYFSISLPFNTPTNRILTGNACYF